ncbi:MAG TPA: hypothetical protein VIA62_06870 [Thermoanaerobaculia bacterium]|jgi:hypothetical protein|nr:hypothetical protein [Thermoanaerobaculia bacterium]
MQWNEIRERYPQQWLLIEAVEAHSAGDQRILDDIVVIQPFPNWVAAWDGYKKLHFQNHQRELYVFHTDRENLEIEEVRSLGLRMAS